MLALFQETTMRLAIKKSLFLLCFLFAPLLVQAEIIEIPHMNELHKHLQSNMLVIFDIDNTLIEPTQELGTYQWFQHRIKDYRSYGFDKEAALEKALREWTAIQSITKVKIVEAGTAEIIKNLQLLEMPIIGLSSRGLGLSTRTVEQLELVNIDLSETAPSQEEFLFMNERGVLFRKGILFTAGTNKGMALKKFLDYTNCRPSSILFINDELFPLKSVESMCNQENIPFVGLRYSYLDEKVKNFRKQIAEVQFYFFGHILSDDAAQRILHEK